MSSEDDMFADSEPLIYEQHKSSGSRVTESSQSSFSQASSDYKPPDDPTQTSSSSSEVCYYF